METNFGDICNLDVLVWTTINPTTITLPNDTMCRARQGAYGGLEYGKKICFQKYTTDDDEEIRVDPQTGADKICTSGAVCGAVGEYLSTAGDAADAARVCFLGMENVGSGQLWMLTSVNGTWTPE